MSDTAPPRRVVVYKDTGGEWRWTVKARNNKIVASSGEGFRTKWGAKRAAKRAVPDTPFAPR